jgi:hypothetical protein
VSSVHRVPFNNVQLQVYIIKIKIVLYTQLSQLSHISLELSKHNIITMCCHTMYLGKKCFFHIISKKKFALGKTPLLPLGHAQFECITWHNTVWRYHMVSNSLKVSHGISSLRVSNDIKQFEGITWFQTVWKYHMV